MWGLLTGKGKDDKDKGKDKKKKAAKVDTANDEDEDLLNFDEESNTIANISAYASEINIEDNKVDEEVCALCSELMTVCMTLFLTPCLSVFIGPD